MLFRSILRITFSTLKPDSKEIFYRYRILASQGRKSWDVIADKSNNTADDAMIIFSWRTRSRPDSSGLKMSVYLMAGSLFMT